MSKPDSFLPLTWRPCFSPVAGLFLSNPGAEGIEFIDEADLPWELLHLKKRKRK